MGFFTTQIICSCRDPLHLDKREFVWMPLVAKQEFIEVLHCLQGAATLDLIAYKGMKPVQGNEIKGEVRVSLPGKELLPELIAYGGMISVQGNETEAKVRISLPGKELLPESIASGGTISVQGNETEGKVRASLPGNGLLPESIASGGIISIEGNGQPRKIPV